MMTKRALITGITGQDGSYLAEFLLNKGYEVHGIIRRASTFNTRRIDHLYVDPHVAGVSLFIALRRTRRRISNVRIAFEDTAGRGVPSGGAVAREGEFRRARIHLGHNRFGHDPVAGGDPADRSAVSLLSGVQFRDVRFLATSPERGDAVSAHARRMARRSFSRYWAARNYRDAYGMFVVNGILFNHESPRRGETFVTRKITRAVARIHAGLDQHLWMGNIDAVRDWGYAPEYVEGMWRMMQVDAPEDFVLATGTGHSVRDFLALAFDQVGLDWEKYVRFDERYLRPAEVDAVIGDASKAKSVLGWKAQVQTPELVKIMVAADIRLLEDAERNLGGPASTAGLEAGLGLNGDRRPGVPCIRVTTPAGFEPRRAGRRHGVQADH